MGFLKSKSKQSSQAQSVSQQESGNTAYPFLQEQLGGSVSDGQASSDAISTMLGLGGDLEAQDEAFQNFQKNSGFGFALDRGSRAITGNKAAQGLLNSGSTAKELTSFGQGLQQNSFSSFMDKLFNFRNSGLQAANVLSGAGRYSKGSSNSSSTSQGSSSGGLGSLIGGVASAFASG